MREDANDTLTISTALGLRRPLYRAVIEAARHEGSTVEQFCRNACAVEFERLDRDLGGGNVGPSRIVSASFEDMGNDIWAEISISSKLHQKFAAQAAIHGRSATFFAERACINALQNATGETNAPVARGPGYRADD